jgi:hypothetical protein
MKLQPFIEKHYVHNNTERMGFLISDLSYPTEFVELFMLKLFKLIIKKVLRIN